MVGQVEAKICSLGDLPVWKGVQDRPGFETRPFALELQGGLIRLSASASEVSSTVRHYGSNDYTFITTPPGVSEWGSLRGTKCVRALAEAIGDLRGKTVLEIGAGTYHVAEQLVTVLHADRVIVCDPVIKADPPLRSIEVVRDYFDRSTFQGRQIDLVVSLNNLEHVPDPVAYLDDVRALLDSTGGMFFVVVPESSRGLLTGDWGICVHEHLSYFTERSFIATVGASGFSVRWMRTSEDALLALLGPGKVAPVSGGEGDDVLLEAAGERFRRSLEHAREKLSPQAGATPRRVAVHGAAGGLNNVLARLKLHTAPELVLFDGDRAKTGKFLPTFDAPIRHAADPLYRSMTDLVIAATTFEREIRSFAIEQHQFDPSRIDTLMGTA